MGKLAANPAARERMRAPRRENFTIESPTPEVSRLMRKAEGTRIGDLHLVSPQHILASGQVSLLLIPVHRSSERGASAGSVSAESLLHLRDPAGNQLR